MRALPPDVPTIRLGIRRRDDPCVPQPGVPRPIDGPADRAAQDPARARGHRRAGSSRGRVARRPPLAAQRRGRWRGRRVVPLGRAA